jgi:tetratricopeptide (TPR) repeat protein
MVSIDPWLLVEQASAARRAGNRSAAFELYNEAWSLSRDAAVYAHCQRHMGDLARELGRPDEARAALLNAERLYRSEVSDTLGLANTVRLFALLEGDPARWRDARELYELAASQGGIDLNAALDECDRHLSNAG